MADYDRNFTPVADLKRKREAEERRKALLTPRKAPESAMRAGDAWAARGNQAAAQLFRNSALRRHQERESDRIGRLQEQLLTQGSTAREKALDRGADLDKQRLAGQQQYGLQKLQGEQTAQQAQLGRKDAAEARAFQALTEGRLSPEQAEVAGTYRPEFGYRFKDIGQPTIPAIGKGGRQGGLPKAPDMMKTRNDLFQQFYDKGRGGSVLRKQYDGDFDKYMADVVGQYGQPPAQQAGALPAAPTGKPSYGTITGGGGVLAGSRGGQPVDPEQYAQSLLPNAPAKAQQQTVEQPTERVQAPMPAAQPSPQQIKFDPMTSEAFKPPQTLAEFKRKQQLEKGVPALPGQERMASLIDKIRRERALRAGGKRYY